MSVLYMEYGTENPRPSPDKNGTWMDPEKSCHVGDLVPPPTILGNPPAYHSCTISIRIEDISEKKIQ